MNEKNLHLPQKKSVCLSSDQDDSRDVELRAALLGSQGQRSHRQAADLASTVPRSQSDQACVGRAEGGPSPSATASSPQLRNDANSSDLRGGEAENWRFVVQIPAACQSWRIVLRAEALQRCPRARHQTPKWAGVHVWVSLRSVEQNFT